MKKIFQTLVLAIVVTGFFSCKKNDVLPTINNDPNHPSMTIDGSIINLNGACSAKSLYGDRELLVLNSNTNDSAAIANVSIGDHTSFNYSVVSLSSNTAFKVGSYNSKQTNVSQLILGNQYKNLYYTGGATTSGVLSDCTVNITVLNDTLIAGTYVGTVYNADFGLVSKIVTGSFKSKF